MLLSNLSNEIDANAFKKLTPESKKAKGQFYTPFSLAQLMAKLVSLDLDHNSSSKLDFLDPAAGTGIFSRALENTLPEVKFRLKHDLYEIDNFIISELKANTIPNLTGKPTLFPQCFLNSSWEKSYDIILANPPYYKHHYFKDKEQIKQIFDHLLSKKFSVQTSVYCWFLIKAIAQLKVGGQLAFIIPSEFLNANYGRAVKEFLKSGGIQVNLISFDYQNSMFEDAITTSLIVYIRKTGGPKTHPIKFYNFPSDLLRIRNKNEKELLSLAPSLDFAPEELPIAAKWKNYFPTKDKDCRNTIQRTLSSKRKNQVPLSHYGFFKRGIATGANNFFTLSQKEVEEFGLPKSALKLCITKASHVSGYKFTNNDLTKLVADNKKIYLLDATADQTPEILKYQKLGEQNKIHQRYLTSRRNPWYSVEKRELSQIWVSVFSRGGPKIVWNETNAKTLTCFHIFYPTQCRAKFLPLIHLYLNTASGKLQIESQKRQYGKGLDKLEPGDLSHVGMPDFNQFETSKIQQLFNIHESFLKNGESILLEADNLFASPF